LFPENTIDGFRQAFDLGLRMFELDVGMTADGQVVVSHDLALNPNITRDASGQFLAGTPPLIHELTYAELNRYDVGRIRPASHYRLLYRAQKPNDGARVPRLIDVLSLLPEASFIIELKTDPRYPERSVAPEHLADAVLAIVDAAGASGRVILESFDWRGPRYVRRIRPDLRLAWLTRQGTERDAALWWDGQTPEAFAGSVPATVAAQSGATQTGTTQTGITQTGTTQTGTTQTGTTQTGASGGIDAAGIEQAADIWAPAFEMLSWAEVARAHDLGLLVMPWTVNRRAAMRRLIEWGVDGLITDRPDKAMIVVRDFAGIAQSA
jgi:glycerophosphoryl diester phosphodiesterase